MRIGVFDSGLGGITLLNQALRQLPNEKYLYYADVDHVPYGEKTSEQIVQYVDDVVAFMVEKGCKAVVVACNTATSVAIVPLRKKYSHIPIIGIEPAVKPAVTKYGKTGKRVLVCATPVTIREKKLKNLIAKYDKYNCVDLKPLPGLVRFAESGEFDTDNVREYLKETFADLDLTAYGSIVLGCTHFNFFKDIFEEIFGKDVEMIDGSAAAIKHLKQVLDEEGQLKEDESGAGVVYYLSGRLVEDEETKVKISGLLDRLHMLYKD